jgi:hypothetical protein
VSEPLVHVAHERAGLRRAFEGLVQGERHVAEFGEAKAVLADVEAPAGLAGLLDAHGVAVLDLEAWLSGRPCKEVFPGVVEVRQHRLTHVGGEVVDPGDLCAKEREFFLGVTQLV